MFLSTNNPRRWLRRLCFGRERELAGLRLAMVVAHPDDECIGAGAQLSRWSDAHVLYVTDGAPRGGRAAYEAGFGNRDDYARARRGEARAALELAGVPWAQAEWLGLVDQEVSLELVRLSRLLAGRLEQLRPDVVLTQPYEGGHPDHDATAFAVHHACRLLRRQRGRAPVIMEMTAYHNRGGAMATSVFLPGAEPETVLAVLSPVVCAFKQRLFDCYTTQQAVLQYFPVGLERFRAAPEYDFAAPPHPGTLYYELFDWGMDGARWQRLAREAAQTLAPDQARTPRGKEQPA